MHPKILIKLFLLFCNCLVSYNAASSVEWQHDNPDFDRSGQITIKNMAGVTSILSNNGQQGLQSSASPTVLSVITGSKPLFGIRRGSTYQVYIDDLGMIDVAESVLREKYSFSETSPNIYKTKIRGTYEDWSDLYLNCISPFVDSSGITISTSQACRSGFMSAGFDVNVGKDLFYKLFIRLQNGHCNDGYFASINKFHSLSGVTKTLGSKTDWSSGGSWQCELGTKISTPSYTLNYETYEIDRLKVINIAFGSYTSFAIKKPNKEIDYMPSSGPITSILSQFSPPPPPTQK